jgi:hypothetical protein
MTMESYWISTETDPRDHFRTEESTPQRRAKDPWHHAEHRLRDSWDRYSGFGRIGMLYRDAVIKPLHDRFNAGDRSFALLCDILSI